MSLIVIPTVNITPELSEVLAQYSPVRLGQQLSRNSILVEQRTATAMTFIIARASDILHTHNISFS